MKYSKAVLSGLGLGLSALFFSTTAFASTMATMSTMTVPVYKVAAKGQGAPIGDVVFTDSKYGLLITPNLKNLTPGVHGFHIHQNPSCADNGLGAGGHLDPSHTGKHLGPYSDQGHLGDLPALTVDAQGMADLPILAPRLSVAKLHGHSLMIHAGGDNYSDTPKLLGGGGARVACGVIE